MLKESLCAACILFSRDKCSKSLIRNVCPTVDDTALMYLVPKAQTVMITIMIQI